MPGVKRLTLVLLVVVACAAPPPPQPEVVPAPAPSAEKPEGSAWVTASTLNVRADATADAKVVTRLKKGTKLPILDEKGGWVKVRLASGDIGWVAAQHISRSEPRRRGGCPPDSDYSFVKTPVPAFSDRQSAHGLVVVDAYVNTKGDVTSTKVVSNTTGDEALAFLTEREIRFAKFAPPIRNCVPRTFIFTYKRSF
jgi:hypothetical protein